MEPVPEMNTSLIATLPNGRAPVEGIITAAQPSAEQLLDLAAGGVRTVVDLRTSAEPRGFDEPETARAAGLEYHNIAVTPGGIRPDQFDAVRRLLSDRGHKPVLVHCASANRVGALLIPYLMLDEHRTEDESLRIAQDVGLRSGEMARAALAYVQTQQSGS